MEKVWPPNSVSTSATPGQCAVCSAATSNACSYCFEAPPYAPFGGGGDGNNSQKQSVFYCGQQCQRLHWPSHRIACIRMCNRKVLARSALLAEQAMAAYARLHFSIDLASVDVAADGRALTLHEREKGKKEKQPEPGGGGGGGQEEAGSGDGGNGSFFHFADDLFGSSGPNVALHRKAALTLFQTEIATTLFSRMMCWLLAEVAAPGDPRAGPVEISSSRHGSIRHLSLEITKPPLEVSVVRAQVNGGAAAASTPREIKPPRRHRVLRVVLGQAAAPFQEAWVVDLAGAQYGIPRVLWPEGEYLSAFAGGPAGTQGRVVSLLPADTFVPIFDEEDDEKSKEDTPLRRFASWLEWEANCGVVEAEEGSDEEFAKRLGLFHDAALNALRGKPRTVIPWT